jgi:hypothetical protein
MAGAFSTVFQQRQTQHRNTAANAQATAAAATAKANAATQALQLLGQPTLTQAEAEQLYALLEQSA